jgi:hypothetical protein
MGDVQVPKCVSSFRIPSFTTYDPSAVRPLLSDDSSALTARAQVLLAAFAFGLELVADVLIMLGTIFYLRKSRRAPSPGFRYAHRFACGHRWSFWAGRTERSPS